VFVGTGLAFINPAGGILNISVPAGFAAANITQPAQINLTGLANNASTPYSVALPSGSAISFTPALPAGAFTLAALTANPCITFAEQALNQPFNNNTCFYGVTIDSTTLVAGTTYVGKITFTGATGITTVLTVNLTATQFPQLSWVDQNNAPMASLPPFYGTVGSTVTTCSNQNTPPSVPGVAATGGAVPNVTVTSSPSNTWLGLNGNPGTPGNQGTTNTNPPLAVGNIIAPGVVRSAPGNNVNICVSAANILTPGTYSGSVTVSGTGVGSVATLQVSFVVTAGAPVIAKISKVGVFRAGFLWILDANGNQTFDGTGSGLDTVTAFGGLAGDIPVVGDWNGSGSSKIGIYRPSTGTWLLDFNGNGTYDGSLLDRSYQFGGLAGDVPVVGDWNGSGTTKVGLYRNGLWVLDLNGNGTFDGGDTTVSFGGIAGDVPVVGDWTGTGTSKVGVVRAGFLWILDTNGNGSFDAGDAVFAFGGITGDVPVVGDWNGSGTSKVGVFRLGYFWVLDTNGDHAFTAGEQAFPFGGVAGDVPVVGKWPIVP
jgi:hypothetical protein